ncbi:RagB/SusD family nutrient uptake outer membrane protein [Pseudobacter ginsenosidimutans]|uniref:Putative outer membrane starch-binding protein n=1 Tax=Pseudobacter ginsenosidimutans TaxID=661488 RepID=A0A4Q7N5U1_9BACT|nr:RagB/SusD family nutrient uptake outer membrane protein [Pseudobacter ginsenosidimutans]QEC44935.1 RagB/SusD family nutrient uptake outer membrane protein [Pseudobacter ginsenosidimutans]RZS76426.1 putative outer membrane starch-binding protein [Pseudobacter ginsenosidimutans]
MKSFKHILPGCLIVCLFCSILMITGCRKFVELDPPKDRLSSKVVFSDSANATAAVLGIYIDAISNKQYPDIFNGGLTIYTGLYTDELKMAGSTDQYETEFYLNNLNEKNSVIWTFWRSAYLTLYKANACIEGIEASGTLGQHVKDRLTGETKFVRAFMYYNLHKVFGAVPLALTTDFATNASMPRDPANKVLDQVVADLEAAKELLPATYPTEGRARPNKYTVIALLARIRLEMGNWEDAEKEASLLINNSDTYALENNIGNVFLRNSREAIWQLLPPDGNQTVEGSRIIPLNETTIPRYTLTDWLWNDFENNDLRQQEWTRTNTIGNIPFNYPYKYKVRRGVAGQPAEPYTVFRLAETILIRAEARARLGNVDGAKDDLDLVRARAGLDPTTANDQSSLIDAVLKERRIELFCEFGHRFTDLKRTNRLDALMNIITPQKGGAWKTEYTLLPLPYEQIEANPFLTQNPGY